MNEIFSIISLGLIFFGFGFFFVQVNELLCNVWYFYFVEDF